MTEAETSDLSGLDPESYRRWRASEIGAITERLEQRLILEMLGDAAGCKILDIGCGDGALACDLTRRGAFVTGIDTSASMIESARERAKANDADIDFHLADAAELPFPDEQFDAATAITILCFVKDARPVFGEIARVLRPGGRFVIGELGKWSTWAASRRVRAWLGSPLWRQGLFRQAGELRRYAEDAGFIVEDKRGAIFYPRFPWAARFFQGFDPAIGKHTTIGAAFLAISAIKPKRE